MEALISTSQRARPAVRDIPAPHPGPGEVSVRVELAGINFADVMALRGDHGYAGEADYVPGLEVVGTVQKHGPGVEHPPIGQRVTGYVPGGGFAELAIVAVDMLVALPTSVSSVAAVSVPVTLSTAHLLLEDVARVRPRDRLLIHSAAGGMGLALAALARRHEPVELFGTVGSEEKRSAALAGGYDDVFVRGEGLASAIQQATTGRGVTVIVSALGTDGLAEDIQMAAPTGQIIRYGNAPGGMHLPLPALADLNAANVSLAGFSRRALARRDPERVHAAFESTVEWLRREQVVLPVTEAHGLDSLPEVLSEMASGKTTGKLAVRLSPGSGRAGAA